MTHRTVAPPFKRSLHFELIEPLRVTLRNGIETYFVSGGKQDVIKIELIVKAGRWIENAWGASHFTSNLLLKGTEQKSSFQIAQTFDFYGAHVEISPGLDVVSVSLYTLTKNLAPTLALLLEVFTLSVFPEKELEQSKNIYLQQLKVNNEKTSFQASKLIRKNLFGESHPYGKELEEKEVTPLSHHHLHYHYETFFKDLFIIVSGKVSDQDQKSIADTFSSLPVQPVPQKDWHTEVSLPFRQIADKEGSVQSSIRIGKRFIGRNHPDYYDVLLLNHILGGYFGSRLMKNIREDKGLSYGIYSSVNTLRNDSYVVIGSDVSKMNLGLAFDEIRKELTRLRVEKVSAEELETARNHFIGSLQSQITTSFAHADKVKNIILYSLPQNHYQKMIARLDAVKSDDLITTAENYFREESFYEVAVG
jgi:zinc protease